jgi:peptide/nickel transport system substrate-binding protein
MRHSAYRSFAAISFLATAASLGAATRPAYGNALRVEIRAAVRTLDPSEWPADASGSQAEFSAGERLAKLVFERLVVLDENAMPRPSLALSWKSEGKARWLFRLRPGVKLHDGSPLTPAAVAAALGPARNGWAIASGDGAVIVQSDLPLERLLAELADVRRSIVVRGPNGALAGTGPFRIAQWEPGRRALLAANEQYWGGRPFLDTVSIEMGRASQDQLLNLETGKSDFVEISSGELRRASERGLKMWQSAPIGLVALVFEPGRPAADNARLREAIALAIDRKAIHNVLLQRQGDPAGSLLPQWIGGYAFLFPGERDLARARQLAPPAQTLVLGYDPSDVLLRAIAERIAVNVRDTGIKLAVTGQPVKADLRVVTARIDCARPEQALIELAETLRLSARLHLANPPSLESVFAAERDLTGDFLVIPLFHLPEIFASTPSLKVWNTAGVLKTGDWKFDDMWLEKAARNEE